MAVRNIIEIDRDRCNGCGLCTTACAEGALVLDKENKAVLVKEIFCDGMGACLDVCPTGALTIIQKESSSYDAKAAYQHVLKTRGKDAAQKVHGAGTMERSHQTPHSSPSSIPCGCPGSMAREIKKPVSTGQNVTGREPSGPAASELSQWPIQLHLVSPLAPYFNECDLLIAADCTAFALGSFHPELLKGKKLAIACPKLDETQGYIEKIAEILKNNTVYSLTVAIMQVPCCSGLYQMVERAVGLSGKAIAIKKVVVGIEGEIL